MRLQTHAAKRCFYFDYVFVLLLGLLYNVYVLAMRSKDTSQVVIPKKEAFLSLISKPSSVGKNDWNIVG